MSRIKGCHSTSNRIGIDTVQQQGEAIPLLNINKKKQQNNDDGNDDDKNEESINLCHTLHTTTSNTCNKLYPHWNQYSIKGKHSHVCITRSNKITMTTDGSDDKNEEIFDMNPKTLRKITRSHTIIHICKQQHYTYPTINQIASLWEFHGQNCYCYCYCYYYYSYLYCYHS